MNDNPFIKETDMSPDETALPPYVPTNPIATFVDGYGEERIIHRPRGRRLSVFNESLTPQQRMNRACSILLGKRIKARRLNLGLSQREVCVRAGLINANPKQYMHAIEGAARQECMRFGTLYALCVALQCVPNDLLPSLEDVIAFAGIETTTSIAR